MWKEFQSSSSHYKCESSLVRSRDLKPAYATVYKTYSATAPRGEAVVAVGKTETTFERNHL